MDLKGGNKCHLTSSLGWYEKQLSVIEQFGSGSGAAQDSVRSLREDPRLLKTRALRDIGNAHIAELPTGCKYLEQALTAFKLEETGDTMSRATTYFSLTSVYLHVGQIRQGQEYAKLHSDLVAADPAPLPWPKVAQQ